MTILLIFAAVVVVIVVVIGVMTGNVGGAQKEKALYKYSRRQFFMTRAEHEFYDVLGQAVGAEYRIFAQVHLPTLVDHKVKGQKWHAAWAHINRKSVDFVLCDKTYLSPKLAIELDDNSHEREDRQERDEEVERILRDNGLPLLRWKNIGKFDVAEVAAKVRELALP